MVQVTNRAHTTSSTIATTPPNARATTQPNGTPIANTDVLERAPASAANTSVPTGLMLPPTQPSPGIILPDKILNWANQNTPDRAARQRTLASLRHWLATSPADEQEKRRSFVEQLYPSDEGFTIRGVGYGLTTFPDDLPVYIGAFHVTRLQDLPSGWSIGRSLYIRADDEDGPNALKRLSGHLEARGYVEDGGWHDAFCERTGEAHKHPSIVVLRCAALEAIDLGDFSGTIELQRASALRSFETTLPNGAIELPNGGLTEAMRATLEQKGIKIVEPSYFPRGTGTIEDAIEGLSIWAEFHNPRLYALLKDFDTGTISGLSQEAERRVACFLRSVWHAGEAQHPSTVDAVGAQVMAFLEGLASGAITMATIDGVLANHPRHRATFSENGAARFLGHICERPITALGEMLQS